MPRDPSGNYSLPAGQPVVASSTISASTFNTLTGDLATALTGSVARDGSGAMSAALSLGNNKITNLANGTASTDAVAYGQLTTLQGQVQGSSLTYLTGVAGTNTITASTTPAIAAYAAGQVFQFIPANTNTGATTLQIGALAAQNVFAFGAACVGGELVAGVPVTVVHDGTRFHLVSLVSPRLNFQHTAFQLISAVTTSVPDASYTRISLNESLDPGNNIPGGANYYVVPVTGNYFVYASVAISITSAASSSVQVAVERTNNLGTNISTGNIATMITAAISTPQVHGSVIVGANAGDRFYLNGFQNNGGARNAQAGGTCFFGGWRIN
jgi:hypothetical protein